MNDEKRFSDSTPTADGSIPEERQILPLTPPGTDEWSSTSIPQSPVSAALDLIKQRQRYNSTGQSRQKLNLSEYKDFLERLEVLPELKGFVDNKLRYVTLQIALH